MPAIIDGSAYFLSSSGMQITGFSRLERTMIISGPQSNASESDRENVIQAFKDWRATDPSIPEGVIRLSDHVWPSIIRRVVRTFTFGFIAVSIALAVVVWQSGGHEGAKALSALQAWLTRPTTQAPAAPSNDTGKVATENTALAQGAASPASARQPTEAEYSALKQQIDAVASELTDVRRIAEQLATNQKQMGEDIAALKASEESIKQRLLSASPRSATGAAAPKRKLTEPPRTVASGRSSSEHSSVGGPIPLH